MTEINTGFRALLQRPWAYNTVQAIFGANRSHKVFANYAVRAKTGDRVIDIGCGTGHLLRQLPDVTYVGYEPNVAYVVQARERFPSATFFAKKFEEVDLSRNELFDVAILSGLLHHLQDEEAKSLLTLVNRALKPGGRVATMDNTYVEPQSLIARFLINLDRGRDTRTPEGYCSLVADNFAEYRGKIVHQAWPPYTYWMMVAIKGAQ